MKRRSSWARRGGSETTGGDEIMVDVRAAGGVVDDRDDELEGSLLGSFGMDKEEGEAALQDMVARFGVE